MREKKKRGKKTAETCPPLNMSGGKGREERPVGCRIPLLEGERGKKKGKAAACADPALLIRGRKEGGKPKELPSLLNGKKGGRDRISSLYGRLNKSPSSEKKGFWGRSHTWERNDPSP